MQSQSERHVVATSPTLRRSEDGETEPRATDGKRTWYLVIQTIEKFRCLALQRVDHSSLLLGGGRPESMQLCMLYYLECLCAESSKSNY